MRYITLLFIITLSLFTLSIAQDSGHSHGSENHHSSEETSDHHNTEDSTDHHSSDSDHHSSDSDHHSNDHHDSTESNDHHESDSDHHNTEDSNNHHGSEESDNHHMSEETSDHHGDDHHGSTESSDHHGSNSDHHNTEETSDHHGTDNHHANEEKEEHSVHDQMDMNESSDSDHEHSHHTNHDSSSTMQSANKIMLGEQMLRLYPLLSPEGDFQIMVQSENAGYTTSASYEGTSLATAFDEAGLTSIDLGKARQGSYNLTFRDATNETTVPVSVYKSLTPSGKAFTTIFAPSPSLSSQGLSEVFIYNVEDGKNGHESISINYSMEGMQHSTDELITTLEHEHFDGLKSALSADANAANTVLESAMSNRNAISFSMVGDWQFKIMVEGEILSFDVAMLDQ